MDADEKMVCSVAFANPADKADQGCYIQSDPLPSKTRPLGDHALYGKDHQCVGR
jgi:hypothetical protein